MQLCSACLDALLSGAPRFDGICDAELVKHVQGALDTSSPIASAA